MTPDQIALLTQLLQQVKNEHLLSPNMPLSIWKALHQVVPIPAVEVIVTRTGKDFLLTYRSDADWDGWHIPGGYMLYRESISEACERIANKELGIALTFERVIDAFMWPDHPTSSALSLVCVCQTSEKPKDGRWFTEIHSKMIPHHGEFLRTFLATSSF